MISVPFILNITDFDNNNNHQITTFSIAPWIRNVPVNKFIDITFVACFRIWCEIRDNPMSKVFS